MLRCERARSLLDQHGTRNLALMIPIVKHQFESQLLLRHLSGNFANDGLTGGGMGLYVKTSALILYLNLPKEDD